MKRTHLLVAILSVLFMAAVLTGCPPNDKLCCESYSPESDEATYCNNHRTAVVLFVNEVTDAAERQSRLSGFETFYAGVEDCRTVDCIEAAINSTLPGFKDRYDNEHSWADRDTDVPADKEVLLILCGFKSAIDGLNKTQ